MKMPCSLTIILLFPLLVNAYTWRFTSPPRQCENVSLSIQGSGGQPPYSLLILPYGSSPLPNKTEVRAIHNIPFSGTTLSFNLNYPENSSFVAVVSDKSGFGTGGVSTPISVLQSSNSGCYSSSNPTKVPWWFYFEPTGGLTQCESVRLWWWNSTVKGTVNFYGAIPGGTPFAIPQGSLSSNDNTGTGFNWTVDIAGGNTLLLIGNDDNGIGTGGVVQYTVANTVIDSCLNSNSPSSTPGNPAGGSYPTSTSGSPKNGSGSHSSRNTGAIIGGLIGAAILLVSAFWLVRRRSRFAVSQKRPVNVIQDDEDGNGEGWHNLPQYYAPEPFLVSDPTTSSPLSVSTVTADVQHPQTPMTPTTMTRKTASLPELRPVIIIQHGDASPSEDLSGRAEAEMIELPPAYSNIHQPQRSPLASSTLATTAKGES